MIRFLGFGFMVSRKRASAAQVVADIFGAGSGTTPKSKKETTRISRPPDGSRIRILFFLTAVAFMFGGGVILSGRIFGEVARTPGVTLTLDGPAAVGPGDNLELTVRVKNNEEDRIEDVTLFIRYPEKFRFREAEPKLPEGALGKWPLSTLDRGAESLVRVKGVLNGTPGETGMFAVVIEYRRPGFALLHSIEANYVVRLETTGLEFTLTSPGESRPGEPFAFKVTLASAETEMANLELTLENTSSVKILDLKPKPDKKPATFSLQKLLKGKPKIIEGHASRMVTNETGRIKAILKKVGEATATPVILAERTLELSGLEAPATLDLLFSPRDGSAAVLGSKIALAGSVRASDQAGLNDVHLSLYLLGGLFELTSLSSEPKSITSLPSGPWTPPPGPEAGPVATFELGDIKAGGEQKILLTFTLPSNAPAAGEKNLPNLFLEAFALLEAKSDGQTVSVRTNRVPLKLSTAISLEANAETKDQGAQEILWVIRNGSNSVRDFSLVAVLGEGVTIVAGPTASIGDVPRYDHSSRQLTWNIPWLPAYAGHILTPITVQMTLKRDPTLPSQGALVGSTTVTARDDFTGVNVSIQIDPILSL